MRCNTLILGWTRLSRQRPAIGRQPRGYSPDNVRCCGHHFQHEGRSAYEHSLGEGAGLLSISGSEMPHRPLCVTIRARLPAHASSSICSELAHLSQI